MHQKHDEEEEEENQNLRLRCGYECCDFIANTRKALAEHKAEAHNFVSLDANKLSETVDESSRRRKHMKDWDSNRAKRVLAEKRVERLRIEDLIRRRKYKEPPQRKKKLWDESPSVIKPRNERFRMMVGRWKMQYYDKQRIKRMNDEPIEAKEEEREEKEKNAFEKGKLFDKKRRDNRQSLKAMREST